MLTNKNHKAFAEMYVKTGNATESYKEVYNCSTKTAEASGSRLLRNLKVKNYIDELMDNLSGDRIATAEEVLQLLTEIARGNTTEEQVVVLNTGDFVSEASIVKKEVSEKDRLKALELLGKRHRLFTDKVENSGSVNITFNGENELED